MAFELAKNRINILGVTPLGDDCYAVSFEYQYINEDKSRVWQKNVAIIYSHNPLFLEDQFNDIVGYVKKARAELEG